VIFVAKLEMVLFESEFLNIKDIKPPILAFGLPDTKKKIRPPFSPGIRNFSIPDLWNLIY
jgi:hypothetical protein